jgi:hypothetical protein
VQNRIWFHSRKTGKLVANEAGGRDRLRNPSPNRAKTENCVVGLPTGERAVQCKFLHLLRDFSQWAFSGDMSGNSADISKGYFGKPIGSSNPLWSASKSLILREKM